MKKFLPSFNNQIVLTIISDIFIAVIIIGSVVSSQQIQSQLSKNILRNFQQQELEVAASVANSLESEIVNLQEKLYLISHIPEVQNTNEDCNRKLDESFQGVERKIGNLGRVNKEGYFACSINSALIGTKAENLGSYISDIFKDPQHKPVMSRAIKPPGAPGFIVAVHVPVYDVNGEFDGTIGGAIYFNELNDKFFKDVRFTENSHVVLLDDNEDILHHDVADLIGKNISSPELAEIADPENYRNMISESSLNGSGVIRYLFAGEDKIGAFNIVDIFPNRKWVVLISTPAKEIENKLDTLQVNKLFRNFLLLNLFIILSSSAIFIYLIIKNVRQLEETNKKLKEVDTLKDEFLSLASHQLKTPASGVKAFLSMLIDGDAGKLSNSQAQFAKEAYEANERELRIVEDLLNVSRIESGRLVINKSVIEINRLIADVAKEQRKIIEDQGLSLVVNSLDSEVKTEGDEDKLKMVFGNLIDNARKYTNSGGIIKVNMEKSDNKVIVAVTDTGIGISEENIGKLFQKFSRIDSKKGREVGGTGLGLYIVKKIVELHGGSIIVKSELGKGTEFIVTLPIKV